jgi:hypothetical protein
LTKIVPTYSIARPSKIYPNWFEDIPSGNPGKEEEKSLQGNINSVTGIKIFFQFYEGRKLRKKLFSFSSDGHVTKGFVSRVTRFGDFSETLASFSGSAK